ncbi:helix-turn-helix domain-containing protein [Halopseudomonas sp. SMJS2]|uniref:helix-turn-helix domain-containing protein n=1 Tax=Halopseudomonas sp. SMJS2 TaxID=3041098 RepID=UPI002452F6C0|nr:helix-turn-helix domain-containing protein [Halopseudomonas sp. SMJS2]WGK61484.1 helix-turn-helix domain-containing protein [Halopseudomonas sp. SMJS2]
MRNKAEKPEAGLQPRQGQNVMGMTSTILAHPDPFVDHSSEAQAARLLEALRQGPVSTVDAARSLDIIHPPSTVRYLRGRGYVIATEWTHLSTGPGRPKHRVGLYVLIEEAA